MPRDAASIRRRSPRRRARRRDEAEPDRVPRGRDIALVDGRPVAGDARSSPHDRRRDRLAERPGARRGRRLPRSGQRASNMTAGAQYGYLLVWVVVLGNVMAWLIQYLSAKLGIVTGRSLPEVLGGRIRNRWGRRAYWLQAELVAMATDLAEVHRRAVALNLLFGVPLIWGGLITGTVSIVLLVLQSRRGPRTFEFVIMGLLVDHRDRLHRRRVRRARPTPPACSAGSCRASTTPTRCCSRRRSSARRSCRTRSTRTRRSAATGSRRAGASRPAGAARPARPRWHGFGIRRGTDATPELRARHGDGRADRHCSCARPAGTCRSPWRSPEP